MNGLLAAEKNIFNTCDSMTEPNPLLFLVTKVLVCVIYKTRNAWQSLACSPRSIAVTQLSSPNLTYKCSTISLETHLFLLFLIKRSKIKVTSHTKTVPASVFALL